eukprot:TRINITY_DN1559_c0_g1_i1.p1 TRINITY_DN1559_c0_g1~~TRINITY_DN1559_c0_g1_i1.p1  ORF type:complete len:433 (+),score=97.55 TRINITY_DN1559_c0_g1_i1:35-1300(+)
MEGRLERILGHLQESPSPIPLQFQNTSGDLNDKSVVIVSAVRTPMGAFNGSLSPLTAIQLGSAAIKASIEKSKVNVKDIGAVYMGSVLQANLGQAPARQAALAAGVLPQVPCTTVNKVCASGMKALTLAASEIMLGTIQVAIAGGMESMSNVPFYLPSARQGLRMGDNKVIDGMLKDGLHDPYGNYAMGVIAEKTAENYKITRKDQDDYALESYRRAAATWSQKKFTEVIPVEVTVRGQTKTVQEDESFKKVKPEELIKLKGAFGRGQTVTAANASSISDGAAAMVITSYGYAKANNLTPIAVIRSWADAASIPDEFTIAPSLAIPLALKRAGLTTEEVDYFEINEAFSVVAEVNCKLLNLPKSKVNVLGGAVALGHPIGCSGARIVTTLTSVLRQNNAKIGCAAICNGGGGATAVVIQAL